MKIDDQFNNLMKEMDAPKPAVCFLESLVTSKEFSLKLVQAGIVPFAALWWQLGPAGLEVTTTPAPDGYSDGSNLPAFTKEELDVMFDPLVELPRIPDRKYISRLQDPAATAWHGASTKFVFAKGADCSARVLLYAFEQRAFTPKEANKRYFDAFKVVEKKLVDLSKFQSFL